MTGFLFIKVLFFFLLKIKDGLQFFKFHVLLFEIFFNFFFELNNRCEKVKWLIKSATSVKKSQRRSNWHNYNGNCRWNAIEAAAKTCFWDSRLETQLIG